MELTILIVTSDSLVEGSKLKNINKVNALDFCRSTFEKFKYYDLVIFEGKIIKNSKEFINIKIDIE